MSKNIYKNTIDSIKVSDEALEKAILNARNPHMKISKSKTKSKKIYAIRATGIIAASLAVVLLLGAVFFPINPPVIENGVKSTNHSFILKASAAEIGKDTTVTIGNFYPDSNGYTYDIDDNEKRSNIRLNKSFDFQLNCDGDDIETITYTLNEGYFLLSESFLDITEKAVINEPDYMVASHMGRTHYSSYTITYYNENKSYDLLSPMNDSWINNHDSYAPVMVYFTIPDESSTKLAEAFESKTNN